MGDSDKAKGRMSPSPVQKGEGGASPESDFSSTMRIEIPPDILAEETQKTSKVDTSKLRIRPKSKKITQIHVPASDGDAKYSQLLQSIYDGVLVTDVDGNVVDSNVRAADFLQYTRSELAGLRILDVISGSDTELLKSLCENLKNERFALLQAYCVRKDGSYFPAEIAVNVLKFEQMRLCFFMRDITLRREAEEMLRTEHNAIQNSGNGIAIVDIEADMQYVNPAVLNLWHVENADALLGKDIRALFVDSEDADALVRAVLVDHTTWTGELVGQRDDESQFDVQVSAACNRDSDGEVVGMVLSFIDISDRKRAEEALRQAERHRVMLASVGAACHHLGQPATVIMTNLALISRMLCELDREDIKEILKLTNEAAEHMADVLHKLNAVDEYRTVQYLDGKSPQTLGNVILDI